MAASGRDGLGHMVVVALAPDAERVVLALPAPRHELGRLARDARLEEHLLAEVGRLTDRARRVRVGPARRRARGLRLPSLHLSHQALHAGAEPVPRTALPLHDAALGHPRRRLLAGEGAFQIWRPHVELGRRARVDTTHAQRLLDGRRVLRQRLLHLLRPQGRAQRRRGCHELAVLLGVHVHLGPIGPPRGRRRARRAQRLPPIDDVVGAAVREQAPQRLFGQRVRLHGARGQDAAAARLLPHKARHDHVDGALKLDRGVGALRAQRLRRRVAGRDAPRRGRWRAAAEVHDRVRD
mmetsp:Transcript_4175/g.13157  ORF Transcript_4175/g.13157 Transcript_4175/m.13157 type:complete len:295 (+) Transcript_4175:693-1577(+)